MTTNFRTAYAESLNNIVIGSDPNGATIPSYITAADTLNVANNNKTFVESAIDVIDFIPQFIAVSMISGANQLYNIPADIGNLFGGEFERSDTSDVITSLDSDLGQFYQDNQAGADLVGFIASSLVPGTLGVRVLNAGQKSLRTAINAGKFGKNTGKALGLLTPKRQAFFDKALLEVTNGTAAGGILSKSALQGIGAGLGQGALEALAFETAITATLFKSPILENQNFGDFVFNVAFGAGVYGLVAGTIDLVKLNSAIKKSADVAALEARQFTFIDETAAATERVSDKIVLGYAQLNNIPPGLPVTSIERAAKLRQAGETKVTTLNNRIRSEYTNLAQGDQEVAEAMFNGFKGIPLQEQQSALIGLEEVTKFSTKSPISARAEKLTNKVATGKASVKELEEFAESQISTKWVKTWGEDTGRVMTDSPVITSLVDTLAKGQVIKVVGNVVTAGKLKFKFDPPGVKGVKPWNIKTAGKFEVSARYIYANSLAKFAPTAKKPLTIGVTDIPMMEKVLLEVPESKLVHINFTGLDKGEVIGTSFQDFLGNRKLRIANELLEPRTPGVAPGVLTDEILRTQDEIAAVVNIKANLLNGEVLRSPVSNLHVDDMLAMQNHAEVYTKRLVEQGVRKESEGVIDITRVPQTLRLTYDSTPFISLDNHVIENMVVIKQQQKLYQDGTGRAVSSVIGAEDFARLQDINSGQVFKGAVPSGAGAGFVTAASANYGTLAATVEDIGRVTTELIGKFRDRSKEVLEPLLFKLGNKPEAAIEWSALQQKIRSIEGDYGINVAGDALEPIAVIRWKAATAEAVEAGTKPPKAPVLSNPDMPLRVELNSDEVRNLTRAHIEINGTRTNGLAAIRTSQGTQFNRAPDVFYPIPIDPKEFPFFAMVTDSSITSGNQSKTLFATNAADLEAQITKLKDNTHLTIRTRKEAEEYFSSRGKWDYEKTLSNNYLDTEAHRKGVSAPFFVPTDPTKITNDMLNWHMNRETGLVREAVSAKYEVQFEELMRLGDEFTNVQTSQFGRGDTFRDLEAVVKNPFSDYIKTALGVKKTADYPLWVQTNRLADVAFTKMYRTIRGLFDSAKTPNDLLKINKELEKSGYKGAHYDESMEIFANATADRGALNTVVQKANALMATVVIRWDVFNAVNNAVSANVLLGTEVASLTRLINRSDDAALSDWNKLTKINVPGTKEVIFSPTKLVGNAIQKFNRSGADMEFYRKNGYITTLSKQYRDTIDTLTFNPNVDSIASWGKGVDGLPARLRKAGDLGEVITGNRLAEEFNRFVAADVMKQMTDVAVARNLMTSKEQLAYINTFVNRTQGNYLAAQRPMMFAGPIGQAIGLFQTYQFNLMQQLLRHVGEGRGKDVATLLALQGTIHGMNGLPAFNAANTYLVGTASGNTEHKDTFDAVYGALGKEAGDWIMYGLASNAMGLLHPDLKVNLYTRGDINPRQVTLIPTDPASIPIVQATAKVLGNIFTTAKRLVAGGDIITTLLQGLEHNGLSRPLAGLAQTLQGLDNPEQASYSTTKRGNIIAANDFLSLANLGRILGGKPLDEAIALDATYRYKAYASKDSKKRTQLGAAIKSTMIAGNDPSQEQIENFALEYAKVGGRQEEFNKWFTQLYKTANLSQSNKIQQSLKSPFSQSMQLLMGGEELRDFTP